VLSLSVLKEALSYVRQAVLSALKSAEAEKVIGVGAYGTPSRAIDLVAERAFVEYMKQHNVRCTILSEESGVLDINGGGDLIVLDPLDGTLNALRGIPMFTSSIAVASGGDFKDIYASVVMNLLTGDLYYAKKGEGAFLNGRRIHPSSINRLEDAIIDFPLNIMKVPWYLQMIAPVMRRTAHVRFLGSVSLSICLVASGALDGFVDLRGLLRIVDIAGATFIAKEAGCLLDDGKGEGFNPELSIKTRTSVIVACNRYLLEQILSLLSFKK